jgi:hypothetical protein
MKVRIHAGVWDFFSVTVEDKGPMKSWLAIWSGDKLATQPRVFNNLVDVRADEIIDHAARRRKVMGK